MKAITYRYYRQEFNYLQERVDALCAGLDFHVQVCEINHPMDPIVALRKESVDRNACIGFH